MCLDLRLLDTFVVVLVQFLVFSSESSWFAFTFMLPVWRPRLPSCARCTTLPATSLSPKLCLKAWHDRFKYVQNAGGTKTKKELRNFKPKLRHRRSMSSSDVCSGHFCCEFLLHSWDCHCVPNNCHFFCPTHCASRPSTASIDHRSISFVPPSAAALTTQRSNSCEKSRFWSSIWGIAG